METYDLNDIEAQLEGLSLQERMEHLEGIQEDIQSEIDDLEAVKGDVESLLCDIVTQINENYKNVIDSALNDVVSACRDGACSLLPDSTLDIAGLRCRFYRYSGSDDQLYVALSGKKPIVNEDDFNAQFSGIIQPLLSDVQYANMEMSVAIAADSDVPALVKRLADALISAAPKMAL